MTYSVRFQPLKRQTKIAADDIIIFYFYFLKKIRLDFSCESSARQRIHMKYQVLFFSEKQRKSIYKCRLLQSLLALYGLIVQSDTDISLRKFSLRYKQSEIKGVEMKIKKYIGNVS